MHMLEPREFKEKGVKYSYRAYVQGVRITSKLLKKLFVEYGLNNNSIYDISIYDKNKVLLLPYTTKKLNLDVPQVTIGLISSALMLRSLSN